MRDIVIIPTYGRPEYLSLCLEHLAAAAGGRDLEFRVYLDRHIGDKDEGPPQNRPGFTVREPHSYTGNAFNFLEAYKEAYSTDARYVYLVEDDVLVGPDFFRWHEAVQARRDYFCTIAWHCIRNPEVRPSSDPAAIVETNRDYSSIGVCWKREKLAPVIQHANRDYYANPAAYLKQAFPKSALPLMWSEQAGLIMRVLLDAKNETVAWAALPRCAHVGISGYHRRDGHKFTGTLEERIAALREASQSTEKMVGLSQTVFDDIAALPPVPEWREEKIHVVQEFK